MPGSVPEQPSVVSSWALRSKLRHRLLLEVAPLGNRPLLMLLEHDRGDEPQDGSSVREDAHHIRAPADLLVNANGSAVPSLSASALTDWGTTSAWSQQLRDCFGLKRPDRDKQRLQLHTSSDSASVKGEWNSRSQSNTRTGPPSSKITMGRPKWGRSGVSRDPQDQRFVIGCLWRDCG